MNRDCIRECLIHRSLGLYLSVSQPSNIRVYRQEDLGAHSARPAVKSILHIVSH